MKILYTAADVNYSLQAQVFVRSLSLTQKTETSVLVFGSGWTARERKRLHEQAFGNVTVEVRDVDASQHSSIRLMNGFPLATAYNILAPQSDLPRDCRAVYLDADMVVRRDLSELFSLKMNHPVGAVVDAHVAMIGGPSMWRPWREEQIDPMMPYLNTGALVVDVERWNEEAMTDRVLALLARYDLPCVDQDAINLVLRGSFDRLRPSFNSMPYHIMRLLRTADLIESLVDIEEAILDPHVIHYHRSFLGKPWTFGSTHPATVLWRELADNCDPRWKKKFDLFNLARGVAARYAKMSVLDERADSMSRLSLERI